MYYTFSIMAKLVYCFIKRPRSTTMVSLMIPAENGMIYQICTIWYLYNFREVVFIPNSTNLEEEI